MTAKIKPTHDDIEYILRHLCYGLATLALILIAALVVAKSMENNAAFGHKSGVAEAVIEVEKN